MKSGRRRFTAVCCRLTNATHSTQFEANAHTNGGPPTHITMDTGFHYTEFIIEWMETLTSASDRVGSWIYTQHRAAADGAAVAAQRYTIWWKTISQLPQSVILIRFRRRRCHAECERKRYLVSDTHKLNLRSSGFVLNGNAFGVGRRTKYNFVNFLSCYRRPVRPSPNCRWKVCAHSHSTHMHMDTSVASRTRRVKVARVRLVNMPTSSVDYSLE